MITLRPYQADAVNAGAEFFERKPQKVKGKYKVKAGVIVAPTAAGKSIIQAEIAATRPKVLILQPSIELLRQNISKYIASGRAASVYSAGANMKNLGPTTYATLGSIKHMGAAFSGYDLIIDECHLYPPQDESMMGRFLEESGIHKVLGMTATPFRLKSSRNSSELKFITRTYPRIFSEVIHCIQVREMVDAGYWSPLKYHSQKFRWQGLKLKANGSDYTDKSLAEVWKTEGMDGVVLETVRKSLLHGRRSILVFVPSVAAARSLSAKTPGSVAVWGEMKPDARARAINGFKAGQIHTVFNVNVLSVGFDHPKIDTIIDARPTMSLAWYYQAYGRGTRIHPSKKDCWIISLAGNFERFGRLENIKIEDIPGHGWAVLGTKNEKVLTGVPLDSPVVVTKDTIDEVKRMKKRMYAPQHV